MCLLEKGCSCLGVCWWMHHSLQIFPNNWRPSVISENGPNIFILKDEGDIGSSLRAEIKPIECDAFELCQPYPIKKVLEWLYLTHSVKGHSRPANKKLLNMDKNGTPWKHFWHYQSMVGILSYLQGSTHPVNSMAIHQCMRFSNELRLVQKKAVIKTEKYLSETDTIGIIYDHDKTQGIKWFIDADWDGGWDRNYGKWLENVLSRSGYVVSYVCCPVLWASKLQKAITLRTAEAKYIALSTALQEVISFMYLYRSYWRY